MNVTKLRFWGVFILMMALLALTACERPFQDETAITVPGANQPAPGEAVPFPTEPAAEGEQVVDPTTGYPAPEATVEGSEAAPAEEGATEETPAEGEEAMTEEEATEEPAVAEPAVNEDGEAIHVVRSGDTIGGIAVLYAVTIEDIAAANPEIVNINVLDVGQEVRIPAAGFAESEEATAASEGTAAGSTEERIHVVRAGDTLYSIGLLYGFTVEELQEYNGLPNPNVLKINDEVKIPPASTGE